MRRDQEAACHTFLTHAQMQQMLESFAAGTPGACVFVPALFLRGKHLKSRSEKLRAAVLTSSID
jgi:hypothetical protein